MRLLVICAGILTGLIQFIKSEPNCHLIEVQQCVTTALDWFETLPRGTWAETEEDADSFCSVLDTAFTCATDFRDKCMTPIQKEIVLLVQDGAYELKDGFCTKGADVRTKWMSHASCINEVSQSEGVKEDIEYILATLEGFDSVPDKDKIQYTCCGYKKMMNSVSDQLHEKCGQETVDMIGNMITTVAAQLPNVICNDVEGTEDKCVALLPPKGSKPTNKTKGTALYQYVQNALKNWFD